MGPKLKTFKTKPRVPLGVWSSGKGPMEYNGAYNQRHDMFVCPKMTYIIPQTDTDIDHHT